MDRPQPISRIHQNCAAASWARLGWFALSLPLWIGCGPNSVTLSRQNQELLTQQQTIAQRSQELQSRASTLDHDNRELESLLAQSRQRSQLLQDELAAVRNELRTTTGQLAQLRTEKSDLEKQTQAIAASSQRRIGAEIRANNTLVGALASIELPGVEVRQDGDVIRIELPGERLFYAGDAALKPEALSLVDSVAGEVLRNYPNQIIGVEGHTDNVPIQNRQFPSNHHLSTARATSVYNHLVSRLSASPEQLLIVGHGENRPVVSNATSAGKTRNRRVELVIYPERIRGE